MQKTPHYQTQLMIEVLQAHSLADLVTSHIEGKVKDKVWDNTIAKNVFYIWGASSTGSYIQMPATKYLPKKALGLVGQFVYLLIKKEAGKDCVIHLDYIIGDAERVTISISSIFKNFKNMSGSTLQVPLRIPDDKWTIATIEVKKLLEQEGLLGTKNYYLRSVQVCSTLYLRGIYTSDIQYTVQTFPKKYAFKILKDQNWYQLYEWFQYPGDMPIDSKDKKEKAADVKKDKAPLPPSARENAQKQAKQGSAEEKETKPKDKKDARKTSVQKKPARGRLTSAKASTSKSKTVAKKEEAQTEATSTKNKDLPKESPKAKTAKSQKQESPSKPKLDKYAMFEPSKTEAKQKLLDECNQKIQQNMTEIDTMQEEYNFNLQAKSIEHTAEVKLYEEAGLYDPKFDPRNINKKSDKFILKPNPIMRLDRVIGWHPHNVCGQIFFNPDPKLSQEILYSQANLLLGYYPPLQKQRLFYERHTNNIDQQFIATLPNNKFYSFTICRSLEQNSKDNEITIWSLESLDTTNADSQALATFKPPMKLIHSLSVSHDGEFLLLAGKDHQVRDLIIVFKFNELVRHQRVEIVARQIADFELYNVKFNPSSNTSVIACGYQNIKFYRIKSGHMAGQAVVLNNTARGKVFTNAILKFTESTNAKTGKTEVKPSICYVTSSDGLLYMINFNSRQVEKVIQIHDGPISGFLSSPDHDFYVTSAENGILRIWTPDFESLKSEVNTGNSINHIDINSDGSQICVLSSQVGTISILDLENSSFTVAMRSHLDNITDITYNNMTGKLVSVSEDFSVKVWHAESMEQVNEFVSENDKPICVASQNQGLLGEGIKTEDTDCLVAIGFQSGFLRILDLSQMKIVHETLLFKSPLMNIDFSLDNRFMAVFFKSGKIVIINIEVQGKFNPVKNIDYDFANHTNCSLNFSRDGSMLANISSNSNTITIWETRNFSLRYHLDLTGDIVSKIQFAPNVKDLVILTTASKLKFYRLGSSARDTELLHIKDSYGITDLECVDFQISQNNRFIVCAGKEGVIKVFDYFMRGEVLPSHQAFMGHYQFPNKIVLTRDIRTIFSIGHWNGIYKWQFYGDKSEPEDIGLYFEELEEEKKRQAARTEEELEKRKVLEGMFGREDLENYTAKQIEKFKNSNQDQNLNQQNMAENQQTLQQNPGSLESYKANPFQNTVDINKGGYVYEKFEMELNKLLACGNGPQVSNNLVWHEEHRYICYSVNNLLVIEYLNQEKTQKLINDGHNQIYQIKLSENKKFLLAYSKTKGKYDAFPCVFIYDALNFKKLNEIAINCEQIDSVEFSWTNNMLLVVSSEKDGQGSPVSTLTVWDFTEGHKDIFCKSVIPIPIVDSQWNPYIQVNADEFITVSERQYHYWRISKDLQLQYQEGELPTKSHEGFRDKSDQFTCICFVQPNQFHHSVYAMLGLKSGYVWVVDAKTNQFLFNVKVLDNADGGVNRIFSSHVRIIIEPANSPVIHCWDQSGKNGDKEYSAFNPYNFFMGVESTLSIDGNFKSTHFNDTGNTFMALSTSGSIWYLSWIENCTLRLKYCHNPQERICCADFKYVSPSEFQITEDQDQMYTFDQNYQISTASSDGQIKLWNMHDIEYSQQFLIPKEECITIAMHQFKPFMVTSFSDGWVRFFDINNSKLLGRTQIHPNAEQSEQQDIIDYVVSLKILPSGNHILAATKYGQIMLIFVQEWNPLSIRIHNLVSINTQINQFEFSHLEPYNKWLVGTANGKVIVYNRKDFNCLNQEIFDELKPPVFNYMDSFNLLDYVTNAYSQTKRCNTLEHFYTFAKRNLVDNEVERENESFGIFTNNDQTTHLSFIRQCNQLFIRNFELHQVVRRIEMSNTGRPMQMQLLPGSSPFICVTFTDNQIRMVDFMNEENQTSIQTLHQELTTMKVCPNGRYILTAGDTGDVSIWNIKKKILGPDTMMNVIKMNNV